jgi:hypothetical protein
MVAGRGLRLGPPLSRHSGTLSYERISGRASDVSPRTPTWRAVALVALGVGGLHSCGTTGEDMRQ